jgi:type II secretory pathway pseudopilin PulG
MLLHSKPKNHRRRGFTLGEVLVADLVFALLVTGLIYGYVQINRIAEYSSMSLAAQSFASQGLEEAMSVEWEYVRWPNTNADTFDPFWTPPAIGYTNLPAQVDTMDIPTSGSPIYVTNLISVSNVCTYLNPSNPPLRQITCYCVWTYPLDGMLCTNTAISLRAPDL